MGSMGPEWGILEDLAVNNTDDFDDILDLIEDKPIDGLQSGLFEGNNAGYGAGLGDLSTAMSLDALPQAGSMPFAGTQAPLGVPVPAGLNVPFAAPQAPDAGTTRQPLSSGDGDHSAQPTRASRATRRSARGALQGVQDDRASEEHAAGDSSGSIPTDPIEQQAPRAGRGGRRSTGKDAAKDGDDGASAKKGGKRYATLASRIANREAQARYKQRQKNKMSQMESAVQELTSKVKQLEAMEAQMAAWQQEKRSMQQAVALKEAEVSRLEMEAAVLRSGNWAETPAEIVDVVQDLAKDLEHMGRDERAGPESAAEGGHDMSAEVIALTNAACSRAAAASAAAHPGSASAPEACAPKGLKLSRLYVVQMDEFRHFFESSGLAAREDVNAEVAGADGESLVRRVRNLATTSMYVVRASVCLADQGFDLREVVPTMPPDEAKKLWAAVAASLALDADQRARVVDMRDRFRRRAQELMLARQELSMQAIRSLAGPDMLASKVFVERQALCGELHINLEQLKRLNQDEKRASAELMFVTYRKILRPLQTGKLLYAAGRQSLDALSFADAVADLKA